MRCWRTLHGDFRPAADSSTGAAACSPTLWRPGSELWRGTGRPRCSAYLVLPAAPWQRAEDGGCPAGRTQIPRLPRWTAGWSSCCDTKRKTPDRKQIFDKLLKLWLNSLTEPTWQPPLQWQHPLWQDRSLDCHQTPRQLPNRPKQAQEGRGELAGTPVQG